jgi:hypothetical protein
MLEVMTTTSTYEDVVDLRRYPIGEPDGAEYRSLVQACRDQLRDRGVAQLSGFLAPAAVSEMIAESGRLADRAWASDQSHTVYFQPPDESAGPDHPRALRQHSAKKGIAYDLIPASAPIRRLYESDDLTAFIAAVLGKPVLYRSADPFDALQIAVFEDGDELGWHFDNSEFSVTVMYAESEAGGHFDYCPGLRDSRDENYPAVRKVLLGAAAAAAEGPGQCSAAAEGPGQYSAAAEGPGQSGAAAEGPGQCSAVVRLPTSPGTLAVFRGQHALHRVTPVSGPRPRINSVLTYGERPGMKLNQLTQELFYGRTG